MSATDELRALLDERGIEWGETRDGSTAFSNNGNVRWAIPCGAAKSLFEVGPLTPAQAIEAALGRGTCRIVKTWSDSDYDEDWRYRCSECGCFIGVYERDPETGDVISADNYCPNCGRKVVSA